MSNNKQSSLDYYITKLTEILGHEIIKQISSDDNERIARLGKQAKAMHKEEQIDSLIEGMYKGQEVYFSEHKIKLDGNSSVFCAAIAEQYYNSTFGGNNENRISKTSNT